MVIKNLKEFSIILEDSLYPKINPLEIENWCNRLQLMVSMRGIDLNGYPSSNPCWATKYTFLCEEDLTLFKLTWL